MNWHQWWNRASSELIKLKIGSTIFQGIIKGFEIVLSQPTFEVTSYDSPVTFRHRLRGDERMTLKLEIELWPVGHVHQWDEPQAIEPSKVAAIKPADKPLEIDQHRDIVDAEII